jgi:hypothetical protein
MNILEMLGLNTNDVVDFFKVLERQAAALEGILNRLDYFVDAEKARVNDLPPLRPRRLG